MSLQIFKQKIEQSKAIDPIGIHHEFREGGHGRKVDFDYVNESPELLELWAAENAKLITNNYKFKKLLLASVANGANQVVPLIAAKVTKSTGLQVEFVLTNKQDGVLGLDVREKTKVSNPDLTLVIDDVGTTGANSLKVCKLLIEAGAKNPQVLYSWQRAEDLPYLIKAQISYRSMIVDYQSVQTYDPNKCQHCKDGWQLIAYKRG